MTSAATTRTAGDRPRAGQGQPRAPGRSPPRATATTSWPRSSMAVGLYDDVTVVAGRRVGGHRHTVPTPTACPPTATTSPCARPGLWPSRSASTSPCTVVIHKDIPVAGGHGRRLGRRRRRPVASTTSGASGWPARTCSRAGRRARQRRPVPRSPAASPMGSGRGELLAPVLARGHLPLGPRASATTGLSTPAVYAECDRLRGSARRPATRTPSRTMMTALRCGDADALGAALTNDLRTPRSRCARPRRGARRRPGVRRAGRHRVRLRADRRLPRRRQRGRPRPRRRARRVGVAGEVRRAKGPVHGAQVVPGPTARA